MNERRRQWHPTPVLLPGKSHGQRSLVGCSPWGCWGSETTERLHFHFSLPCIGEGNGNPLQCFAWRIPGTGEPGGLPSMGSHRVGHDWSNLAAAATSVDSSSERFCHINWLPFSPLFLAVLIGIGAFTELAVPEALFWEILDLQCTWIFMLQRYAHREGPWTLLLMSWRKNSNLVWLFVYY